MSSGTDTGCGERIGVYEPTIVDSNGEVRATSVTAEPDLAAATGDLSHRGCHAQWSNARQRTP